MERNSEGVLHLRGNELCSDSVIPQGDAAFMRVGSPRVPGGAGGGGGFAFDRLEAGKDPTQSVRTNIGMWTGSQAPDGSVEIVLHALKQHGLSVDADMLKLIRVVTGETPQASSIEFLVPIKGPAPTPAGVTDTMWSPDGMSFTQQQSDGNFVTYGASVPFSKANVRALWSAWTGFIQARALIRDAVIEPFSAPRP